MILCLDSSLSEKSGRKEIVHRLGRNYISPDWLQAFHLLWGRVLDEFSEIRLSCVSKLAFKFVLGGGRDKHKLDHT